MKTDLLLVVLGLSLAGVTPVHVFAEPPKTEAEFQARMAARKNAAGIISAVGDVNSALAIYYGDHNGVYPKRIEQLVPQYIPAVPEIELPDHAGRTAKVTIFPKYKANDAGGWGYVADPQSSDYGKFFINCTHVDSTHSPKYPQTFDAY